MKKKTAVFCRNIFWTSLLLLCSPAIFPDAQETVSYQQVADSSEMAASETIGKYGMLPVYGRDVKDGTWPIEVESSSRMFRVEKAELTVQNGEMQAALTLSGTGYLKLFMGTGTQAAASEEKDYTGYTEDADGRYVYTVPVEALDRELSCAAFSIKKQQWYDRTILFDASTLPPEALLLELPDYEKIEAALAAYENEGETDTADPSADSPHPNASAEANAPALSAEAMSVDLKDGSYAIDVTLAGGSGKAFVVSPTYLYVRDGRAYARLTWSSSNYDYMIVGGQKYLNTDPEGASSIFEIPVAAMDTELPVIADTTAMGTPHEVEYTLTFYSDTIGSTSQMPQEAAKRVVIVAFFIIVGGGILNHFVKKKRSASALPKR